MRGTVSTKLARLGAHLLTHPSYLPRYMQQSLLRHKTPLDLEMPWFSYAAIEFLEKFLKPHMKVAEYVSGVSTIFFARRAAFGTGGDTHEPTGRIYLSTKKKRGAIGNDEVRDTRRSVWGRQKLLITVAPTQAIPHSDRC